jgi:MFS family permease
VSAPTGGEVGRAFRAIARNHPLLRVLAAFCLFGAAEFGTWVAILVYAYTQGGTTEAGVIGMVLLVPPVFVAPLASSIGDRMRRDHALGLGYMAQAVAFVATGVVLVLDVPSIVVYAVALVATSTVTLTRPVHLAILPDLSDSPQELIAGNSASATLEQLGFFLGPILSAALLAIGGPGLVFIVLGAALVVAAALTASLPNELDVSPARSDEHGVAPGLLAETRDGIVELRGNAGARSLVLLAGAHWLVLGLVEVLVVPLGVEVLRMGESGPGALLAATGLGGFLGALATVTLVGRPKLAPVLLAAAIAIGAPLAIVSVVAVPAAALFLLALTGAGSAFFDVSGRTLVQRFVHDDYLSRVFGLQESIQLAGLGIGSVLAILAVAVAGTSGAFVVAGVIMPVLASLMWRGIHAEEGEVAPPGRALEVLRRVSPFDLLPTPTLERIARELIQAAAADGDVVIREGDPGDRFYVIAEGSMGVWKGGERVTALGVGDYFGEIALLRDVPRTATVIAEGPVELFALEREEFLATVSTSRALAAHAAASTDRRLHGSIS